MTVRSGSQAGVRTSATTRGMGHALVLVVIEPRAVPTRLRGEQLRCAAVIAPPKAMPSPVDDRLNSARPGAPA